MRSYVDTKRLELVADKLPQVQQPVLATGATENEEWHRIEEFGSGDAYYEVSSLGNVRLIINKKPYPNEDGYPCVRIIFRNKRYERKIHRLVAQAFVPNPFNLPEVNHKDLNRGNAKAGNLEWMTSLENMRHSFKFGNRLKTVKRGSDHANSKLAEHQIWCIRAFAQTRLWRQRSIGRHFGVTQHAIWCVVERKVWAHVASPRFGALTTQFKAGARRARLGL